MAREGVGPCARYLSLEGPSIICSRFLLLITSCSPSSGAVHHKLAKLLFVLLQKTAKPENNFASRPQLENIFSKIYIFVFGDSREEKLTVAGQECDNLLRVCSASAVSS